MFYRRSAIEKLEIYFDESFKTAGDADLICRMLKAKVKMGVVRRYFSVFVDSGDNLAETPVGRQEMARMARFAPLCIQRCHNLVEGWQKVRKLFAGSYFLRRFSFQIILTSMVCKQVDILKPSGAWKTRRSRVREP